MKWLYLGIIFIIGIIGVVSADSSYCIPSTGIITDIQHSGIWWNITIDTTPDCYVWMDAGYGDVTGVTCGSLAPVTSFTSNVTCGNVPASVQFTDTSTGTGITNYYWDFGDGNTSILQNPVTTYGSIGVYTVSHYANSTYGTTWSNITNYMRVLPNYDTCAAPTTGGNNILQWIWLNH